MQMPRVNKLKDVIVGQCLIIEQNNWTCCSTLLLSSGVASMV